MTLDKLRKEAYEKCLEWYDERDCAWLLDENDEDVLEACIQDPYYCCAKPCYDVYVDWG